MAALKKTSLLLLLFLLACTPLTLPPTAPAARHTPSGTALPTPTPTISPTPPPALSPAERLRKVFEIDERCPHICWLGINPGVTTAEQARARLKASDQIVQVDTNEKYVQAVLAGRYNIFVYFEQGFAKSIYLDRVVIQDFTMNDFSELLGKPDEIRIGVFSSIHCTGTGYFVYYASRRTVLEAANASWDGPNPRDRIFAMTLNSGFDDVSLRDNNPWALSDQPMNRQSWLGYGHLQAYLPGQDLPTGPCQPLPTSTP